MTTAHKVRELRLRRHRRVRKKVRGTVERPRLAVFRSNNHISAQVIDDISGRTLAAASTTEADLRSGATGNKDAAKRIGALVADDHQGREREAPAALDDLRDAVDLDDPLLQIEAACVDAPVDAVHTVSPPSRTPSANALTRPWYR